MRELIWLYDALSKRHCIWLPPLNLDFPRYSKVRYEFFQLIDAPRERKSVFGWAQSNWEDRTLRKAVLFDYNRTELEVDCVLLEGSNQTLAVRPYHPDNPAPTMPTIEIREITHDENWARIFGMDRHDDNDYYWAFSKEQSELFEVLQILAEHKRAVGFGADATKKIIDTCPAYKKASYKMCAQECEYAFLVCDDDYSWHVLCTGKSKVSSVMHLKEMLQLAKQKQQ
jgi:hypothetical protein